MSIETDYTAKVDSIVAILEKDPTEACKRYGVMYQLADELTPDNVENYRVLAAVKKAKGVLTFNLTDLKNELDKRANKIRRMQERAAKKLQDEADEFAREQAKQAGVVAFLGVMPKSEREYIALAMNKLGYDMTYDRKFIRGGEIMVQGIIQNDLHLTAGDLGLIKPHGDLLSTTLIDRAFDEWCINRKEERKQVVKDKLDKPMTQAEIDAVNLAFQKFCTVYYKEADFAEACIRKAIWQVKRKLFGLEVNQMHFFVVVGSQNAGKTWTTRKMFGVIDELMSECSLSDALDDRQIDLPQMYVLFIDELARLDRVDSTSLKTFITGEGAARRPMRTNAAEKVKYNATLFATSNRSLDMLIYDNTGMRRYVEIHTRTRAELDGKDGPWDTFVAPFDWLSLWQSVDMYDEDPLISKFSERLMAKQEDIRTMSHTEAWAREFEYDINPEVEYTPEGKYGNGQRYQTNGDANSYHIEEVSNRFRVTFFHDKLYQLFRQWEDVNEPSPRPTGKLVWGKEMKSLIDTGALPEWSHYRASSTGDASPNGPKVVFAWRPPQREPQQGLVPSNKPVHDIKELLRQRQSNRQH